MADSAIWMPIYWGDYLGKTSGLTCEEHGAYLLLIAAYWQRRKSLPDDDRYLATVTKLTLKKWKIIRPKVIEYFVQEDSHLHHERVEKELVNSCRRMTSAQAKAYARWHPRDMQVTTTVTTTEDRKKETSLRDVMPKPKKRARSQLPEGFPFQADFEWSNDLWCKHGRQDLCATAGDEAAKFRDHHSGKLTMSADWPASWRTWARNAIKFNSGGRNAGRSTAHDNFAAGALAAAMEDGR